MIKDCLEDYMLLKNTRKPLQLESCAPGRTSFTKNMGGGIPTVEDVEKTADLYYGPTKRAHLIAWTYLA